jgi:hypothetical protein
MNKENHEVEALTASTLAHEKSPKSVPVGVNGALSGTK